MNKTMAVIGGITIAVGGGVDIYGYYKYDEAHGAINLLSAINDTFGNDVSSPTTVWQKYLYNSQIYLIIGTIILLVGIGLLIYGLVYKYPEQKENSYKYFSTNNSEDTISNSASTKDSTTSTTSTENTTNTAEGSLMHQLKELDELKAAGYLSDEEYEQKRKNILDL